MVKHKMKVFNFDEKKAQKAIKLLLESFGENLDREGIKRTPERVAEFYKKALSGNTVNPLELIPILYTTEEFREIVLVKNIYFYSICEHHLLPFFGKIHIAYIPNKNKIVGVSKIIKLIDIFASRLQIQERFTKQVVDTFMEFVRPCGVMMLVEAEHLCVMMSGVKTPGSKLITSATRGVFLKDVRTRSEAISLLRE
ncbi:MAG: GTP cyclohydrolase I FolE [Endomicrobium sp.]|jgi:GTP cyclohydrolase I|nr:GTP cyclohydrolase I FolE [Endomicrobium sp.]